MNVLEAVQASVSANAAIETKVAGFLAYVEHQLPQISDPRGILAIDRMLDALSYNGRGPFSRQRAKAFLAALEIGADWLATHPAVVT